MKMLGSSLDSSFFVAGIVSCLIIKKINCRDAVLRRQFIVIDWLCDCFGNNLLLDSFKPSYRGGYREHCVTYHLVMHLLWSWHVNYDCSIGIISWILRTSGSNINFFDKVLRQQTFKDCWLFVNCKIICDITQSKLLSYDSSTKK